MNADFASSWCLGSQYWSFNKHDKNYNPRFGILPLLSGTLVSSAVALLVAIPLGTIIAIYLSEFAPFKVREIAKCRSRFSQRARLHHSVEAEVHAKTILVSIAQLVAGERYYRANCGASGENNVIKVGILWDA